MTSVHPTPEGNLPLGSILVGLVGAGIGASLTPRMHEEEGAAQGLRYVYRLIDLDVLGLTAAFWHISLVAGIAFLAAGCIAVGVHSSGYVQLEYDSKFRRRFRSRKTPEA